MTRLAIVQALEAAEAGDHELVVAILLVLFEELEDGPQPEERHVCVHCGAAYVWPGELVHHQSTSYCWRRAGRWGSLAA